MQTIQVPTARAGELELLEEFATSLSPALRDVILSLSRCVRDGDQFAMLTDASSAMTPSQAAEKLGMSRTHLYKLLDRGEIPFHRVGRDRRILLSDLLGFETRRQADRRELAERFAAQSQTRAAAIDELSDLI